MSHPAAPKSLSDLNKFKFQRIINEDPLTHSIILLGTLPSPDSSEGTLAIVRIEKTALSAGDAPKFLGPESFLQKADLEGSTDIVCCLPGLMLFTQTRAVHLVIRLV
jgi:m7GpppX diphosphatase